MPTNAEVIFNTLFNATELTERPKAVVDYFVKNNGKRVTAATVAKMSEELGFEIKITTAAHMTSLRFKNGDRDADMLIAYALKNVTMDADFIVKFNTAYLSAADSRNAKRNEAMSNQPAIDELAAAVEAFKAAEARLKAAFVPFAVERHAIESNLGLDK